MAEEQKQSVIEAEGIHKIFNQGEDNEVVALQNINLNVQPGELISLIGPSGCGKSTLLRLIADLIEPTAGMLKINGKDPHQARLDRDYGMVFQAATLYEWRTVSKNVQLPLEIMGYPRTNRERRAQEMLEMVDLGQFGKHYPWQLSGGMQQRVSIARALAFEPSLLLMDEPFGALDEFTRHSIAEAVFLSSRLVVMSARPGRITEVVGNDLPYPRDTDTRELPEYFEKVTRVRELLRDAYEG
jgi:NitT/TauT family transport system ATP-binding protein